MKPLVANNPLHGLPETLATVIAVEYLRALGWRCEETGCDGEEFEIGELADLLGVKASLVGVRLHHPGCPPARRRCGPTGRVLSVVMTPELEAWLSIPKQPGCKLSARRVRR